MKKLNVLITGASSGIGSATVRALVCAGHNVMGMARRHELLEEIKLSLKDESGSFEIFCGDVKSPSDIKNAVNQLTTLWGSLDTVIPNAGLGHFNPLDKGKLDEWHNMVDVNVTGVLNTLHATIPHLLKSKGHVINIGSLASRQVFKNSGVYCATKHFVLAISESLRMEYSGQIAVTTINPGAVNTEFIIHTANDSLREEYVPNFASGMSPDFIAGAILEASEAGGKGIFSEITLRPDRR
ncbi:MAG: oxidoreductase [Crocinitomicaceae bacterium]|nr:oxidoreductase [Crocinitomicaceae bacterium]